MNNKASITALMSAFSRAFAAENIENLAFCDNFAKRLITDEEYRSMCGYILSGADFFAPEKKEQLSESELLKYIVKTFLAPTPLARAKFCEDSLKTAVITGTSQYVILGAGLDTFAFRQSALMQRLSVFEVDHPCTQKDKLERIKKSGLEVPKGLFFVPCDFSKDDLCRKLLEHGFDKSKKTFFSWLGVSYYMYRDEIESFIESIASFAAEGSSLLFDYAGAGLFLSDVKRVRCMIEMAKAGGEEMKSGFDYLSMQDMLASHGFLIYEHLTPNEIQQRYFDSGNDAICAFEHINYTLACRKGK